MKRVKFYDFKTKKSFSTSDYKIKTQLVKGNKRKFAVTTKGLGNGELWTALPKDFKK